MSPGPLALNPKPIRQRVLELHCGIQTVVVTTLKGKPIAPLRGLWGVSLRGFITSISWIASRPVRRVGLRPYLSSVKGL